MGTPLKIANILMAALFVVGAIVQWNDPDPAGWIAIYVAAALACGAAGRASWAVYVAVITAVAGVAWGGRIASEMPRWVTPTQMFEPMESRGGAVELAREVWGLGIIVLWMLFLIWKSKPRKS